MNNRSADNGTHAPAITPAAFSHPVASVEGVRERLLAYGCKPNKALGQNFLTDPALLGEILSAMDAEGAEDVGAPPQTPPGRHIPPGPRNGEGDNGMGGEEESPSLLPALEIGPGLGALTEGLLASGRRVVAVEKDAAMVRILNETLPHARLTVLQADALRVSLQEVYALLSDGRPENSPILVAGNLPYYITTPLCVRLLASGLPIARMALMVQQEAAARFFARPGADAYGPLAVLTARAFHAREVMRLPPSAYYPQPGVHSSVVLLRGDAARVERGLPAFLAGIFNMRRKTLLNNLLGMGFTREEALHALGEASISPGLRAEALPPEALFALFYAIRKFGS